MSLDPSEDLIREAESKPRHNGWLLIAAVVVLIATVLISAHMHAQPSKGILSQQDSDRLELLNFKAMANNQDALKKAQDEANKLNQPIYDEANEIIERVCKANNLAVRDCDVNFKSKTVKAKVTTPTGAAGPGK